MSPTAPAPPLELREPDCRRVELAAPRWRCVWLPQHGSFLAFLDADMRAPGMPTPAVAEPTADATIDAIHQLQELEGLVREWIETRVAT
ncbi:hypothetical protein [Nocardiopsis sp. B62]|uniref:hypothetical protein n=1 Tax=Nocardiopsis sp. B62 TaxID=2824874 RepID=UPI001B3733C0|nr:hypothetical protein [Nocardiopsis sp. B62]MBQ1081565.1 hypothetical protein [Nocardiopsis sp. B62]